MAVEEDVTIDENEKLSVVQICKDFLGRGWTEANFADIVCRRISSGVANKTYYCSIEACKTLDSYKDIANKDVIVHVSGNLFEDKNKNVLKFNGVETVICQTLHKHGMAPKLLGAFPEGRIEEYIPSKPASVEDLASLEVGKAVMRKIAKFHSLDLPISKRPNFLEKVAQIYHSTIITKEVMDSFSPEKRKACLLILEFPFEEEYAWITKYLSKIGYKVVCSHNDLNPNNILLKENMPLNDRILLIDYELCNYFYRGYDIAYFFRRKNFRFKMDGKKLLIEQENVENTHRNELLEEYLKEELKLNPKQFDPKYDNVCRLSMEVDFFDLVNDIFSVGLRKSVLRDSSLVFNWELATNLIVVYEEKKQAFIHKYGNQLS